MSGLTDAVPRGGRYLAVVVMGFVLDLGVTLAMNRLVGLSLTLSAAMGFGLALGLNYLLFEFWVFRRGERGLSGRRLGATVVSSVIALSARLIVVEGLSRLVGTESSLRATAIVLAGALASMAVNYLLVSRVFRPINAGAGGH